MFYITPLHKGMYLGCNHKIKLVNVGVSLIFWKMKARNLDETCCSVDNDECKCGKRYQPNVFFSEFVQAFIPSHREELFFW